MPEVTVPELPADPREYTKFLNSLDYFETTVITDEDKMRGNLYVTERLRKEVEKQSTSKEDFLDSLSLELTVYKDDESCLPRLAQLTEKTNQFNTKKSPLTESQIETFSRSNTHSVYYGRLQDTFGDYGVVIFGLIEKQEKVWHIRALLMSCRIFGKGVEEAFFMVVLEDAKKEGVEHITIECEETEKNAPARTFVSAYFIDDTHTLSNSSMSSPSWITTQYENI